MPRLLIQLGWCVLLMGPSLPGRAQESAASAGRSLKVGLQVKRGENWQAVDPRTVLHTRDEIQFRFETSGAGYLYVFDISSGGKGSWLYPRADQGQINRVEPGQAYVIPGINGSFTVGGDAGYDVTYWIVSPTPLDLGEFYQPQVTQPNTLRPRCGETLLKARGMCLDDRAGPGPVPDLKKVPLPAEKKSGSLVARDLTFHSQESSTRIIAPDSKTDVIVYQFLIAHQ